MTRINMQTHAKNGNSMITCFEAVTKSVKFKIITLHLKVNDVDNLAKF